MRIEEFSVSAGSYPGVGLVAREMGECAPIGDWGCRVEPREAILSGKPEYCLQCLNFSQLV